MSSPVNSPEDKIWLSIDFDYFVREDPSWDFGHGESAMYMDFLWAIRAGSCLARGMDLREETSPRKYAVPTPREFWEKIAGLGFDFSGVKQASVADSHMYGFLAFDRRPQERTRIVHFDAHHDLGYRSIQKIRKIIQQERADCSDWLFHTIRSRKVQTSLVYPTWKGAKEWDLLCDTWQASKGRDKALYSSALRFVHGNVWSETYVESLIGKVERVFICRSGAWVPPWLDGEFIRFVAGLEKVAGVQAQKAFLQHEGRDPLKERNFSWEEVEKRAEIDRRVMQELADRDKSNRSELR